MLKQNCMFATETYKMKPKVFKILLYCLFSAGLLNAQETGTVKGKIIDQKSREALPFVNILVYGTSIGATSDGDGNFEIKNVPFGYVKIQATFIGYQSVISEDYLVTNEKVPYIILSMKEDSQQLNEVVINSNVFKRTLESPLSVQSLGVAEIEKNPGGNRDILRVLQSLPGVASTPGFRNDVIVRGGSSQENRFFLDGIEIPVINHYQTQGSTGGPVGILNADLIRNATFYASAFPANRGNLLSSAIEFTQKDGNPERLNVRATLGTSDAGITLDGPLGENTSFMMSLRQSYLQFLFKVIKLPFLPTYNDAQIKVKHKFNDYNELTFIGVGAIDNFELNEEVNDDVTDEDVLKRNNYALSNIPIQEQWNYTVGLVYKHYAENSTQELVVSRNEWNNDSYKYFENIEIPDNLLYDYTSKEIENKIRFENTSTTKNDYRINVGGGLQFAKYLSDTYQKVVAPGGNIIYDFNSELNLAKYSLFGQISKEYFNSKFGVSFGLRFDGSDYSDEMSNLFKQFSPRLSLSYQMSDAWSLNGSLGTYYQMPAYTILGFRDENDELANKNNGVTYINTNHYVVGLNYQPEAFSKVSFEGFYKSYSDYPFSVESQISLANLGADFGVVGNEEVESISEGRAYGFELNAQKRTTSGFYGIASYTYVLSEFKDKNNEYVPSSWDNKHLLTLTAGTKLGRNWEIGGRFRLVGGAPYTPYDMEASSLIENYDISNSGILDYDLLNTERYDTYTQLDLRIDKTWYWKSLSLNFYIDIQNLYAATVPQRSFLIPEVDENGNKVIDPADSTRYVLEEVESTSGNVLPGFGFIFDF